MIDSTCQTCRLLWLAMGGTVPDPMDTIAGSIAAMLARDGGTAADLVVVVGPRGLDLPLEDVAVGPFVFGAMPRAELVEWARRDADACLRAAVAPAAMSPPEGRVWILLGVGTKASGLVTLVNHDLPTPSTRGDLLGKLSLVPRDGGPAPGRRAVKGGSA